MLADVDGPSAVLARLADPARTVGRAQLAAVYAALAGCDPESVDPPERIRVPDGDHTVVLPAAEVVVLDAPDLIPLLGGRRALSVPGVEAADLADVLAVALAGEEIAAAVPTGGTEVAVPDVARRVLAGARQECPASYREHDALVVAGIELEWRWVGAVLHASTTDGVAAGLAWAAGAWSRRWLVAAALGAPEHLDELLLADELG